MKKQDHPYFYDYITGHPQPIRGSERFYIDRQPASYFRLHHHDYAELSYYVEGDATETINGVQYPVKPGTMSFLLPYQLHITTGDPERRIMKYRVMFDLHVLTGLEGNGWFSRMVYGTGSLRPSFVDFDETEQVRVDEAFRTLLSEYERHDSPDRYFMIRTKLQEIILLFIRKGLEIKREGSEHEKNQEDSNLIWPLLQYVNKNYSTPINLAELAAQFNLSNSYISRFFKKHVGMGLLEYVQRLRIERAANMLLHTNMTITEITFEVGFETTRTFARAFREIKGQSARDYRVLMKST